MAKTAVLVGCGAMAKGWLKAIFENDFLSREINIVGLVDLSLETAQALAAEFNMQDVTISTDLEDILQKSRPDIVFDVVVPTARHNVASIALKNDCHVLSEKPMANSMLEANKLLALAKQTGKIHAIIQNRRYISGVRRIHNFIDKGGIGDITAIHCDFFIGAHFGGFREEMDHVLLLDMAIHTFDAARFIINKTPLNVYCQESNPNGSWYQNGAAANAIFEFSDNCTFTYRGSWCAEGINTSWESEWRIIGTKGTLIWDGLENIQARLVANDQGFIRLTDTVNVSDDVDADITQGHTSVIIDFLKAINTNKQPETVSSDNIKSLAMVFGAIESAETGKRVYIKSEGK